MPLFVEQDRLLRQRFTLVERLARLDEERMSAFSRRKGAAAEREFINAFLRPFWPKACRNIDQFGDNKTDCLNAGGCHWQIKRQETTKIWAWIEQAEAEAPPTELPIVAFRRNRSKWYCVIEADELVTLLRLREDA